MEFEFSVGQPEVALEMVLKQQDFEKFCEEQKVTFLDEEAAPSDDEEKNAFQWSLHDATHHFRDE